ncbi:MAG TPA: ribonuclease P protein component 1 [Candidatus Syntrophoarchaeum butanivorans]|uniref:Ribonuclease P protein component 1 n=1 Tax=Candidatus Syntropharchaeum butanivorans TaxID=1839936 RepID=A0A1F2P6E5_9EURY|nr:MAG: ribonuclease P [Candidatus Syntrophoarchaeum butanivorans]HDM35713.1 ribonuclease P protein component 1 [Candidatus Syntrophoarchaeum butanivorans]HEC56710.1 ribonuclease P protein component 1 [Candidatus Syntrophoarchaeum butanivorans]
MKITPDNLIYHELIGLDVVVEDNTNPSMIGIAGKVVDETRNMLVIEENGVEKMIPKSQSTFLFRLPDGQGVRVEGRLILARPEDRTGKLRR